MTGTPTKKSERKRFGKNILIPFMGILAAVLIIFFLFFFYNPASIDILSYLQQKENLQDSIWLIMNDSKEWHMVTKGQNKDQISALKKAYLQKKLDNIYVISEKKNKSPDAPLNIYLPGVSKKVLTLQMQSHNLQILHSTHSLMLYRYLGQPTPLVIPKTEKIAKTADWVDWKLWDALFPVRMHKNKESFLTGNSSMEFQIDNRFSYFLVSKDAIFTKCSKGSLLLLLYAQKSDEPIAQSIRSCWVSLYVVDEHKKMTVLNMADINPDIEKQQIDKDGWLLRAQIAQVPQQVQGVGFAVKSEISVQFDDFVLFVLPANPNN